MMHGVSAGCAGDGCEDVTHVVMLPFETGDLPLIVAVCWFHAAGFEQLVPSAQVGRLEHVD